MVHLPLMALIDYLGHRLVAMARGLAADCCLMAWWLLIMASWRHRRRREPLWADWLVSSRLALPIDRSRSTPAARP